MFTPTSENSADVTRLRDRLAEVPIGETITFAELEAVTGRDVSDKRRYLLVRAMDRLNTETGAVFENVFGIGYQRVPIDEVPNTGGQARRRIRKIAARCAKRLANAASRSNDVPAPVMLKIMQEQSVLGVLQSISRDGTAAKAATDATETSPAPIALVARRLVEALR